MKKGFVTLVSLKNKTSLLSYGLVRTMEIWKFPVQLVIFAYTVCHGPLLGT